MRKERINGNYINLYVSNFSEFYKNELFKNEKSIKAKNYLKERGLSGVDVKNFNLGFVTEDLDYYEI